jgi:hypothetical protein
MLSLACCLLLPQAAPRLEFLAAAPTGAPGAEIVSVQAATRRLVLTHADSGALELFDLADPARPRAVRMLSLGLAAGEELTSAALPPSGDYALAAVRAKGERAAGRLIAVSLVDGKALAAFPCGVGPDSVAISADGAHALVANEAEEFEDDDGADDSSAPGSLTHVRLAPELASSKVTQIPFTKVLDVPTDGRELEREVDDVEQEIPLGTSPAFIEPEVVLFLDSARALVTLQENNALAYVDLINDKIVRVVGLGTTTHPADLRDDKKFADVDTLLARREPDGIALVPGGKFFVTADEGDTGPNVEKSGTKPSGGGRTLSVFELESARCVGDTGPGLDRAAAGAGLYPDKRSNKKGSEPEMVVCLDLGGRPYAAVTLERAGALALVDLGDPAQPTVVGLAPTGAKPLEDAPEGLALFRDPSGTADYLYVANEGTGTLGVLRVSR